MKRSYSIMVTFLLSALLLSGCGKGEIPPMEQEVLWTNNNIAGVQNEVQNPTIITLENDSTIAFIFNYHYFNNGTEPGTIALIGEDGTKYGPWQATGRVGQGDVKNAYWDVYPDIELKKGNYTVVDSDPETWSNNDGSDFCGFTEVRGTIKQ